MTNEERFTVDSTGWSVGIDDGREPDRQLYTWTKDGYARFEIDVPYHSLRAKVLRATLGRVVARRTRRRQEIARLANSVRREMREAGLL